LNQLQKKIEKFFIAEITVVELFFINVENIKMSKSTLEQKFLYYWNLFCKDFPAPEREQVFHVKPRWRADFMWRDKKIIVEIEGGTWSNGAHVRGLGYTKDCKKYNAAQSLGYKVFRATSDMLKQDPMSFIELIKKEVK
jgi:very-short-patch-repair endonuclease